MKKATFLFLFLLSLSSFSYSQSTGCIYGDCVNGYGKYVWDTGDEYIGDWVNGQQEGNGTLTYKDGGKYTGEFVNGYRQGMGTFTWASGVKHSGQWMKGNQHGEGTYIYADGTISTGIWENGKWKGKIGEVTGCIYGDCSNGKGTYIWKNGEKYNGEWKNNKRNGQGTNYFANGLRYEGEWKDDLRNGFGTDFKVDGTIEKGLWDNDRYTGSGSNSYGCISGDCSNGYGIYTWESGEKYEGYWKFDASLNYGKRHGYGVNYFSNGAKYDGNWVEGKKQGKATYTYQPESIYKYYTGEYVQGNMTGDGVFEYKDGKKYVGEFKDNYFHGEGTLYYPNGKIESGIWEKDVLVRKSTTKETGCISGNCENGFGTYVWKTGGKYIGDFENGKRDGKGTYTFENGDVYKGDWKNGTYDGQGTYKFKSGSKYVGEWANGKYNGIGTMFYKNGTSKTGLWENDEFKGKGIKNSSKPEISWITPTYTNSTEEQKFIKAKVCIKSETDLQNVQFYVNGIIKVNNATRGYTVVNASCDYTVERELSLENGKNIITVKVTNTAGTVTSDTRTVIVKQEIVTTNQKRLALIIGNGNYTMSPLKNPTNDANVIAKELRNLGFEVLAFTNLSQNDMKKRIREFGNKLSSQKGIGLFYYAGHGLQLNGENYIVPVNAVINKEQDVELEAVNLKRILGEMDYAGNDLNIVILDACRNNPFARSFRSGGGNGYASVNAPKGTYIAFATAPGSVASDGTGDNGLYTQELVKALKKPGLKIEDVFKQVRNNVYNISGKQQLTWENSSIFGDFYFKR